MTHYTKLVQNILLFTFISMTNPIIFMIYFIYFFDRNLTLLGYELFTETSTNVYLLNLPIYTLFAVTFSVLWVLGQYYLFFRKINILAFIKLHLSIPRLILGAISSLHLFIWVIFGMELNIMGFIFFPLFLLLSAILLFLFILKCIFISKGKYDQK